MKPIAIFFLFLATLKLSAQTSKLQSDLVSKWTKSTINVLCYSQRQRDILIQLDSAIKTHRIDSTSYRSYVKQLVGSGSSGSAIWLTYRNHNFLISARHVLEDLTAGPGKCFSNILIIEHDTTKSLDLQQLQPLAHRTYIGEIGLPSDLIQVHSDTLYSFSSVEDDVAVLDIDSSYYSYGVFKLLRKRGYIPVQIRDVDTLFKSRNGEGVIAIGYPNESVRKVKNDKELPIEYALMSSPVTTLPIISFGTIYDIRRNTNSFEVNINTYHGYSGGPIINSKGQLIGVTHGFTLPSVTGQNMKPSHYEFHGEFKKSSLLLPLIREVFGKLKNYHCACSFLQ